MNGLEFTAQMVATVAWPIVVLVLLLVFRRWITATVSGATAGARIKRIKLGPVEAEFEEKAADAARSVAGALAENASPPPVDGPVPTFFADLIPLAALSPRDAIRMAFAHVRRALVQVYPQLADVGEDGLPDAVRELARRGLVKPGIADAVTRLRELAGLAAGPAEAVDARYALQYLTLAEGAIHAVLRAAPAREPGPDRWRGTYDGRFPIELSIQRRDGGQFTGLMRYPDPGPATTTRVQGEARDGVLTWRETAYITRGGREIDLRGRYEARISGDELTGSWYQGEREVAGFVMTAAEPG
ncbi:hypothetical protein [Dactylosporangium sp. CA-233914]|uniref:hypothetical protein n=1 Tax=Dactylosporangium sp. CA-233914 TaxID=3239934 RepID=UPI003D89CC51